MKKPLRTYAGHNQSFINNETIYFCGNYAPVIFPLTREQGYIVLGFDKDGWPIIKNDLGNLSAYPSSIFVSSNQIRSRYFE